MGHTSSQPKSTLVLTLLLETLMPNTSVLGHEVLPPPPPPPRPATVGWTKEVEAALMGSSLKEEHRTLVGVALQGFRSAEARMREVFKGFIRIFEVLFYLFMRK